MMPVANVEQATAFTLNRALQAIHGADAAGGDCVSYQQLLSTNHFHASPVPMLVQADGDADAAGGCICNSSLGDLLELVPETCPTSQADDAAGPVFPSAPVSSAQMASYDAVATSAGACSEQAWTNSNFGQLVSSSMSSAEIGNECPCFQRTMRCASA